MQFARYQLTGIVETTFAHDGDAMLGIVPRPLWERRLPPDARSRVLYPLITLEEKKMLLVQALEDDGVLFFEHEPDVAACRLREEDGQPALREAVAL